MTDVDRRQSPVQFRPGFLAAPLDARGDNRNQTADRDLARYYALLDRELATLNLTPDEALAVLDALNGTWLDEHAIPLLWADIEDAIRLDALDEKWSLDGPALLAKLKRLTFGQAFALADAAERWWRLPAEAHASRSSALREVGLIR